MAISKNDSENSRLLDEKFMHRCIQIAKNGLGTTAPNPMVGSVIVHKGKIIGEGHTSPYGGPHAEVNAINSVTDNSLLGTATLYVTLEPCSHFGKTPPCADLIVKHKIARVVIGLRDPHEKVAGKGIKKLRKAGCEVEIGILKSACEEHHKRFLTFYNKKRPYIILKWAETLDGFIAPTPEMRKNTPKPYWITNSSSRQLVHKWRSEEQAILVGTQTVLDDNPLLNVRNWSGKSPIRIVLDRNLRIPNTATILDGKQRTIVLTAVTDAGLHKKGVEYVNIDFDSQMVDKICNALYQLNIQSVLIEGGAQTIQSFINEKLWDEARIFKGATHFKNGIKAPKLNGTLTHSQQLKNDTLTILKND